MYIKQRGQIRCKKGEHFVRTTGMYMKMGKYNAFTSTYEDGNVHENRQVRCFY